MFFFSKFPYLNHLSIVVLFSVFILPGSLFCLSSKGASAWVEGNRKVSLGSYNEGEALLTIAFNEGRKSQNHETKNHISFLISNDLAACLEKRGRHQDAAGLYESVVANARNRKEDNLSVHHVGALRGLIRCHLALSLPTESLLQLMHEWYPSKPASYFMGSTWFLVPFHSSFESSEPQMISFLSDFFLLTHSQSEELLSLGVQSVSSVRFFEIGDIFLSKLRSFGKNISQEQLVTSLKEYTKNNSPVIPLRNLKELSKNHKVFEEGPEPRWLMQWKMIFSQEFKAVQRLNQLNFLMSDLPTTTPFKEIRSRILLERGILYLIFDQEKMAREAFLQSSRSDQYGSTRTTASAMSYILGMAFQEKDIGLCRKAFHRAERFYLFSPKILKIVKGDLFLESADQRLLESVMDFVLKGGKDIAGWTMPPKGLLLSASGNVLFWENFEEDLTKAPSLKSALTALKILSGHGFFSTPEKGWLVDSLLGSIENDDI